MRKFGLLFLLLSFAFISASGQAKDHSIKFNMFGMVVGQYQLAYEMAIQENISLQLSAGYISRNSDGDFFGSGWESNTSGVIVIPEFRYYFNEALEGAYIAGFARIRSATTKVDFNYSDSYLSDPDNINYSYKDVRSAVGGGLVIGYQALLSDAVILDIFFGPQTKSVSKDRSYNDSRVDDTNDISINIPGIDNNGFGARVGINLGFAF